MCSKSTTCAVGKFQAAAASGASDTTCTTCKTCGTGKYQAAACQLTSDTSCTDCTVQPNGKFVRQACSGFSDAVYENCKTSCPGTHFIKSVCTLTDDLVCEACSVCNDDQYQVSPCDTAVNAVCAACTVCPLNSRQTKACSDTADTVCSFEPAGSLTSSVVTLSSVDLNSIKKLRSLATEKANTRLSIATAAAEDFEENDLGSIAASSSEGTCGAGCTYTADTTDPKVTDFALNLNVAQPYLMITFSETVLLADFDPTKITLQSAAKRVSSTEFVTLKAGSKEQGSNTDPTILKLVLDSDDVDTISSKRLLALNEASTCMVAKKEMAKDAAKLQRELTPITDQAAKPAKTLTPDDIDPALKEWTLNMKTGKLVVSFTEVMDAASIKTKEFTIQNGATASGLTRKLDTSESFSTDAASFEISLNDDDLNFIKKATTLATLVDKSDSYLILSINAASDTTSNTVTARTNAGVGDAAAKQAKLFVPDTKAPTLVDFKLDLNAGEIELELSEAVKGSVDATQLTLQTAPNSESGVVLARKAGTTSPNGKLQTIKLTDAVLNAIKLDTTVATVGDGSSANTYLTLKALALVDMNDQPVTAVTTGKLVKADEVKHYLTPDTTGPAPVDFKLNMKTGKLVVDFNEVVKRNTIDMTKISVHNQDGTRSVTLTKDGQYPSTSVSSNGLSITVDIGATDLNKIKADDAIATDDNTHAYVTFKASGIVDMNDKPSSALTKQVGAENFQKDDKKPTLVAFDLNMDDGKVELRFSETIKLDKFLPKQIVFQPTGDYTNPAGQTIVSVAWDGQQSSAYEVLTFTLDGRDLNAIKADKKLCTQKSNCWISFAANTIQDMQLNQIDAIAAAAGKQVNDHGADTNKPTLLSFKALMPSEKPPMTLELTFSETVDIDSIVPTKYTLFAGPNGNEVHVQLSKVASKAYAVDSTTTVILTVHADDLASLRAQAGLVRADDTTYIEIDAGGIEDNADQAIVKTTAPLKKATEYTVDITPP